MQVHNVRVDTVSEMSTKVDHALTHISITVETVSGMSTEVDPLPFIIRFNVETVTILIGL